MFKNMTLIVGDEIIQIFIILISSIILFIAWRSTFVREILVTRTAVVIIDNNRRRLIDRVSQHPVTIIRTGSVRNRQTNATNETQSGQNSVNYQTANPLENHTSLLSVLDEINQYSTTPISENFQQDPIDLEPQQIIQEMDNESPEGVRRRRVVYFESAQPADDNNPEISVETLNTGENSNIMPDTSNDVIENNDENTNLSGLLDMVNINKKTNEEDMRIKLKYLNDELKLVQGKPSETIGDFKKRNFSVEIANQKFVRLVFNGHVLQPDTKTLQTCGLFDNCVVHCLVHNRKPQSTTEGGNTLQNNRIEGIGNQNTESNQSIPEGNENGRLFVYLGMCCVCLALIFCWGCRFQYSYLFSWYSTTGLVLMTTIFLVLVPLNFLIERDSSN